MTPDDDVLLLDTSSAIALLLEDHDAHGATLDAVRGRRIGLAGHAWFETYSVLTRLPAGQRRTAEDALALLEHNFPSTVFLDDDGQRRAGPELARAGIAGGAVYDGLVGLAARHHGRRLATADACARGTYDALGVAVSFVR